MYPRLTISNGPTCNIVGPFVCHIEKINDFLLTAARYGNLVIRLWGMHLRVSHVRD